MPIYEYECSDCDFHFERRQRFDEEPIGICPECQGKARRVIHSVPVIFKGSGFYVTDNRKSSDIKLAKKKETPSKEEKVGKDEGVTTASH
ncbi:FmdB family zinc ribbon protein [Chloroflexota bacterium]